jgi:uncharacterized protein YjbI with pentapeptide repeats
MGGKELIVWWVVTLGFTTATGAQGYEQYDLNLLRQTGSCTSCSLARADLSGLNLYEADLSDSDLSGANLSGVNLTDADLSGAKLLNANLAGTNLTDADLSGANLLNANLAGANLEGVDLSDATWPDGTVCRMGSMGQCR